MEKSMEGAEFLTLNTSKAPCLQGEMYSHHHRGLCGLAFVENSAKHTKLQHGKWTHHMSHLFGISHDAASCFCFYELFIVRLCSDSKFCYMLCDSISLLSIKNPIFITMFKQGFHTVILHFQRRTQPGMSNKEWQAFLSHRFYSLHYINLSCCLPKEIKCLLCNPAGFRGERFWWTEG